MRLLTGCLLALLAACSSPAFDGTSLPPRVAPDFTLVDQYGAEWSLSAQRGMDVALYFGYSHCKDECPLTLAKLARAISLLHGTRAEIAFVTVDPARDTRARLKLFVEKFHGAKIAALTGPPAALQAVYRKYHVWVQRQRRDRNGGYDVSHSTPVFLIDARGMLRVVHFDSDPPSAFVHDLQALGA